MSVLCLEARGRIGGRIHTVHDARSLVPVELGAEFVHGRPRETFDWLQAADLHAVETGGRMLHVLGGSIAEGSESGPLLEDLKQSALPEQDESFQSFLDRTHYPPDEKLSATGFVEGFNAARKEEV